MTPIRTQCRRPSCRRRARLAAEAQAWADLAGAAVGVAEVLLDRAERGGRSDPAEVRRWRESLDEARRRAGV